MTFFMRWFWRGLLALGALFLLLVAATFVYDRIERAQRESFYKQHPLLQAMSDAPSERSRKGDVRPQMSAVLLKAVPLGTARGQAALLLEAEGFRCSTPPALLQRNILVCLQPGHTRWIEWMAELTFDHDDKMTMARATVLDRSLP